MSRVIISDQFDYCTDSQHRGTLCNVSLTTSTLDIKVLDNGSRKKTFIIELEDVTGCRAGDSNDNSVLLSVYYYIFSQTCCKKSYRRRGTLLLRYRNKDSLAENRAVLDKWRTDIISIARRNELNGNILIVPKLLVFVNPNSGKGNAIKMFKSKISTLFEEADINYDLIVTDSPGHCENVVRDLTNVKKYAGIVAVSGDGLLYEIYNGLIGRSDWQFVCDIPVGVVPQGSGNGLARSLAHLNGEPYLYDPMVVSVLNILKLRTREFDLCLVNTVSHPVVCSFLSVGWGLFADIDIESERYRFMGETRFTFYALARILNLRTYTATLSYLPAGSDEETTALPPLNEPLPAGNWITSTGKFISIYSSTLPFIGTDLLIAPQSKIDDGIIWLFIIRAPISKLQLMQLLLAMSDGSHVNHSCLQLIPVKAFRLVPELTTSGHRSYLDIDGEQLDSQAVQVQVMPRKGRVFMR